MNPRLIAILSLVLLLLTLAWAVLLILDVAQHGPVANFEQALQRVSQRDGLFTLTYLNAALLTVVAVAWMAALYLLCRPAAPAWALIGLIFVPVYGVFNLFAYLSQVSLVPALVGLRTYAAYRQAADLVLYLTIQQWSGSAVAFFNNLAYAILSIPSIIFAVLLYRQNTSRTLRAGAILLALSGVASLLGILGILLDNALFSNGSLAGGALFLLALFLLTWSFWKNSDRQPATDR